ncbi:hypothetical protein N7510_005300 [Penicillium lagena]|uniref:uncharacterized protein n=1 Tax=Penicillium lagena TaxID=94218 RepID=UPI00254014F6|nr:uncharacterized protein N7510_005300 [Penicillium lagena]KAJ5612106.1 hypothetical protein N7510_005300 [Penicillium lagena]
MTAPTPRTPQVPQHVTALLSHLTSRPGVHSTLILSRRDGSIIQGTGLLAPPPADANGVSHPSATDPIPPSVPQQSDEPPSSPASPAANVLSLSSPYQPSQAEALAAHIFAFVSSASALGVSLSRPASQQNGGAHESQPAAWDAGHETYANGTSTPREEDRDADTVDVEEDEIKLLRMRTRKHEIVVVPDKKYLLCVVHDAAHASGGPGVAGARVSR